MATKSSRSTLAVSGHAFIDVILSNVTASPSATAPARPVDTIKLSSAGTLTCTSVPSVMIANLTKLVSSKLVILIYLTSPLMKVPAAAAVPRATTDVPVVNAVMILSEVSLIPVIL